MTKTTYAAYLACLLSLLGCSNDKNQEQRKTPAQPAVQEQKTSITAPAFSGDSAFAYIEKQVAFGPRVPNTKEHKTTAKWLENKFAEFGWLTHTQEANVTAFNGKTLEAINIIARFDTANSKRIMLFAHWDTRPFADRGDKDRNKPIDGANDGGSGVGVLLEIARSIANSEQKPAVGIDIILFDAEDYGTPEGSMGGQQGDTWCLGSQYWAKNPSIPNYKPRYGILLDMVGAENAVFPKEAVSMYYAANVVEKVWRTAQRLGYGNYFINLQPPGGITDDHLYINKIAGIPSIDIIHYEPNRMDFGAFHHTHDDNMEGISKTTLAAVGHTMMQVIYEEQ